MFISHPLLLIYLRKLFHQKPPVRTMSCANFLPTTFDVIISLLMSSSHFRCHHRLTSDVIVSFMASSSHLWSHRLTSDVIVSLLTSSYHFWCHRFTSDVIVSPLMSSSYFWCHHINCQLVISTILFDSSMQGALAGLLSSLGVTSWVAIGAIVWKNPLNKLEISTDGCHVGDHYNSGNATNATWSNLTTTTTAIRWTELTSLR